MMELTNKAQVTMGIMIEVYIGRFNKDVKEEEDIDTEDLVEVK